MRLPPEIMYTILQRVDTATLPSILQASRYLRQLAYDCVEELYTELHASDSTVFIRKTIPFRAIWPFTRLRSVTGIAVQLGSEHEAIAAAHFGTSRQRTLVPLTQVEQLTTNTGYLQGTFIVHNSVKWLRTFLSVRQMGQSAIYYPGLTLYLIRTNVHRLIAPEFVAFNEHGADCSGDKIARESSPYFRQLPSHNLICVDPVLLVWITANYSCKRLLTLRPRSRRYASQTLSGHITTETILSHVLLAIITKYKRNRIPWPSVLGPPPPAGYNHAIYHSTETISNRYVRGTVEYLLDRVHYIRDPETYISLISDTGLRYAIYHDHLAL